ncbi:hypothetical protein LINPERPRIM_LOCUS14963 [Linum perenne]
MVDKVLKDNLDRVEFCRQWLIVNRTKMSSLTMASSKQEGLMTFMFLRKSMVNCVPILDI